MDDQIVLAEAMGWSRKIVRGGYVDGEKQPAMSGWLKPDGSFAPKFIDGREPIPDPFTDANDDYAVLEWMRHWRRGGLLVDFRNKLDGCGSSGGASIEYRIGDYARAALEVINHA